MGFAAQAAHRAAACIVTVPAARCPSLQLTAVSPQPHDGADPGTPTCSAPARRQLACGSCRSTQAPAFQDHQPLSAIDDPASQRNGDPGATTSTGAAGNGAEVHMLPSSDAELAALRAELDSLRLTVNTQAAAAQQQFSSITSLEREVRGGARSMNGTAFTEADSLPRCRTMSRWMQRASAESTCRVGTLSYCRQQKRQHAGHGRRMEPSDSTF